MTYTLWSRGELLGETTLDYVRIIPHLRTGDLHLNQGGLRVIERLCQHRADAYYAARRLLRKETLDESDKRTLDADLAAQRDAYETLALELRTTDGSVIPTDDIYVTDTEYLRAIDREAVAEARISEDALVDGLSPEDQRAFEEDLEHLMKDFPPWLPDEPEREPVRFQIGVRLKDEFSIP
jgi:hypothetical protein